MAATSEYGTDDVIFAKKESKMGRKQERALRRVRKMTKRNLRLDLVTEVEIYAHESQTEASEVEGTMTTSNNIGYTKGVATSATELSCEMKTGQPAKDGAVQREEEEEAEEQMREKRRMERK